MKAVHIGLIAASVAYFSFTSVAAAQAQRQPQTAPHAQIQNPGQLVAHAPDLQPIPSRIEHGVVSVRNTGTAASAPSIATVNCHLPGQGGGCGPDLPDRVMAPYEDPAYPNMVVVQIPAIQPGHVYSHNLSFWDEIDWQTGSYQFDFVVDAASAVAETNEANNTGSHVWAVP
jgi:hypothetical protein